VRRLPRLLGPLATGFLSLALFVGVSASGLTPAAAAPLPAATAAALHPLGARRPTVVVTPGSASRNAVATLAALPATVDLRKWAVTPGDQGALASCVAWTIDYSMLGWYARFLGVAGAPFAPMYTYAQLTRSGERGIPTTDALQLAVNQGTDTRAHYPQGDYDWRTQPTAAQHTNAARFKIAGYTTLFAGANQVGSITRLKNALATKHPVAIAIAVRTGFDSLGSSAAAVDNDISSPVRGYHEVLAVGYDAAGLIIENSWGKTWAGDGFGRLSWRVVQHDVWEAQTIKGFAVVPTPPVVTALTTSTRIAATRAGTTTPYTFTWRGAAGTSGAITHYEAWYQIDGGALTVVHLASPLSTSFTLNARVGHQYRVAVRAGTASKVGAVRYGTPFVA
jgi:hypothetical protein